MPFNPPSEFRDYQKGDFVFGLSKPVEDFITGRRHPRTQKVVSPGKVDSVRFPGGKPEFKDKDERIAFNKALQPVRVKDLEVARDYVETFSGARLDRNVLYFDFLQNHLKYQRAYFDKNDDYKAAYKNFDTNPTSNALFRAKSKAGLLFCIQNDISLHFILDDLVLEEVIGKNREDAQHPAKNERKDPQNPTDKIRTVTGSELRWIYRYRTDPDVQRLVQFWINDTQCCPPWEPQFPGTQVDWSTYQPTVKDRKAKQEQTAEAT